MADVKQIYEILNDAVAQAFGSGIYDAIDSNNLVSVGEQIKADGNTDVLGLALLDRVGKVIIEDRAYKSKWRFLAKNEMEWGAIVEKVHTRLMTAQANSSYTWAGGTAPDPYAINLPDTDVKLFKNITTFEVPVTIPDDQLKTAFLSAAGMESFITSIFTAVENSVEFYFETEAKLVFNTAIAICKEKQGEVSNRGVHVVNLLTDYNTLYPDNTIDSADVALYDEDFLKYAVARINDVADNMATFNTIYNIDGYERFTPKSEMVAVALNIFANTCQTHMQSNIYHDTLVTLPMYETIPYFQTQGTGSFADRSKLKEFTPAQDPDEDTAIEVTNVVFALMDNRAIGAMLNDERVRSQRNERGEYTNYWYKGTRGNFIDTSEQMCVFTLN